ncbi:MAG: pilus assembly protein [Coriobacteriaceae bacterium]|nr:pilus assembly protein [Coriobacteriaceae bacterium]MCI7438454.1 pilus assembly protein [Coriobacteriaceae bacterium]MDD7583969.1 TadE/TadG family type IV pilus assembly protein [Coriobacteriaceae bacterium]
MGCGRRHAGCAREAGQATVEAAVLLPVVMVVLALLLQPAMLLYTRAVMSGAVAEGARLAATASHGEVESLVGGYVRRRLKAVPNVACFHEGGSEAWDVAVEQDGGRVRVVVRGRARPLPLVGVTAGLVGQMDGGSVLLSAMVERDMRAEWVEGDYDDWIAAWG